MKYLFLLFVFLCSLNEIRAQIILQSYIDIGESNVSEGVFVKNVYRGSYQYQKFNLEAGMQFDFISNNSNTFTGLDILGSRELLIKNFSLDIKGFYMLNRFSYLLYETNWGVRIETRTLEHFLFELGTNFRTYTIKSEAREEYSIINRYVSKLNEKFNLMYMISAYLKPYNNDWNLGLSCTNIDYYIIKQSTNPVFNLQMIYKVKSNLSVYLDTWYKQAGIFNISANYFGYLFRGGVIWKI